MANLGNADNLTGHHFSQANLFAFGRQAWDWTLDSADIADDWVRMTWSNREHGGRHHRGDDDGLREALVSYQTPLGIAHQFRSSDHYGPKPSEWFGRDDWSPVYYNKADSVGLGYDRSPTGSDFAAQYFPTLDARYGDIDTVPENLLMWFHHVPWDHRMRSGRIFWDELVYRYQMGVQYVTWMRETWDSLEPHLDARRFSEVRPSSRTTRPTPATGVTPACGTGRSSAAGPSRWTAVRCRSRSWSTVVRSAGSTCPRRPTRSRRRGRVTNDHEGHPGRPAAPGTRSSRSARGARTRRREGRQEGPSGRS